MTWSRSTYEHKAHMSTKNPNAHRHQDIRTQHQHMCTRHTHTRTSTHRHRNEHPRKCQGTHELKHAPTHKHEAIDQTCTSTPEAKHTGTLEYGRTNSTVGTHMHHGNTSESVCGECLCYVFVCVQVLCVFMCVCVCVCVCVLCSLS